MCGIAGVVGPQASPREVGLSMAARLHHRGPDARGVHVLHDDAGNLTGVFAHTRLQIIDLSEAAAQPFVHMETGVSLVFNGEIYGFQEERKRLEGLGFRFRSRSDTEVILAAYLLEGFKGLDRLDGMFAFGLWDPRDTTLILARDRMGKKPLYWTELSDGRLAFASEAKALREVPGFSLELDPSRIPEFLTFGYVGTPRSAFMGVRRLQAASRLIKTGHRRPRIERFWNLEQRSRDESQADVEEIKRAIRSALGKAVERRMVSDVPVGAFLSGGVDSSIVVAEMAKRTSTVRTFAVGFDDDATYDETKYAKLVSKQFGTEHTELRVRPDAEKMFETLLEHHDEPYGDSSALAVHAVAEATRKYVTVVLTGDGGDEVFGGYTRFAGALLKEKVPTPVAYAAKSLLEYLPEPRGYKNPISLGRRFVEHAGQDADVQMLAWNSFFAGPKLAKLLNPDVYPNYQPWSPLRPQLDVLHAARSEGRDRLDQILLHNLRTYLLDDLLVKTDRMTMAVSLEARSPFLDTAMVEMSFRIPSAFKIRRGSLKWILREAYRDVLGPEVLDRRKHGFGVPVGKWWSGPLRPLISAMLLDSPRCGAYLEVQELKRVIHEHHSGRRDHGQRIFALLQLELFLRAEQRRAQNRT